MEIEQITQIKPSETVAVDEDSFVQIINAQKHSLVNLAWRLVGNAEEAKDLAQWAFARLWMNRHRLHPAQNVYHYLRRALVNLCIDYLRKRGRQAQEIEFEEEHHAQNSPDPSRLLEGEEMQNLLRQCIERLKPKQKATLILRDVEGYSVKETAEILECSENNVLGNLHLARKNIKQRMQPLISEF